MHEGIDHFCFDASQQVPIDMVTFYLRLSAYATVQSTSHISLSISNLTQLCRYGLESFTFHKIRNVCVKSAIINRTSPLIDKGFMMEDRALSESKCWDQKSSLYKDERTSCPYSNSLLGHFYTTSFLKICSGCIRNRFLLTRPMILVITMSDTREV